MKLSVILLKCILALNLIWPISGGDESVDPLLVTINQGKLQGLNMTSASGRTFASFRGIPYAKPPIGPLRFMDPVSADPWEGVFNASHEGSTCIQFDILIQNVLRGEEDCLKLNVYSHDVRTPQPKPVMVWIHGGGFMSGSGNAETDLYGPNYLMNRDIVLVTINYRLGPFGFLSTEDAEAPGNYGLLDQSLALKWVRENIQYFGGDPKSVTIFGESAGGASVEFHILSPRSAGLFNRAIAQSGSSQCTWALLNSVGEYSKLLAELLNCPTFPTKKLVDCLRNRDPIEIARFSRQNLTIIDIFPIAFGPRIDLERESPFVPAHPQQLIENKQFNHVPFITGMNENEGSFLLSGMLIKNGIGMQKFKNDPVKFMRYILGLEYDENGADIARHVIDHVFDKKKPLDEQPKSFEKLFSDSTMFHCIDKSVKLFSKYNEQPTFTYFYTHRGQNSFPELIGDGTSSYNDFGVSHFDEIFMLFNNQIWPPLSSPEDVKVSNIFIDYWTSFANNGTPQSGLAPQWLPTKEGKTRYLKLNENPALKNEALPFSERLPFWNYVSQLAAGKDQQPSTSDVNSGGQVIYYFRWIWF